MIKVLIVENEQAIADQFSHLLIRLFNDIELLEVCDTVATTLASIQQHEPDVVFLDVELNNGETGFDILRHLTTINFEVIFVTAHNKYAVEAIKCSALDYLLKPVVEEDVIAAFHRFNQKKNAPISPKQLEVLFSNFSQGATMNQVALPTMNGLDFVAMDTIIYCEGMGSQSAIYMTEKTSSTIISKTLKECELLFSMGRFFRIHKSYLINLNHVRKYTKGKDGQVLMSNSQTLDVSRNYKENFLNQFTKK